MPRPCGKMVGCTLIAYFRVDGTGIFQGYSALKNSSTPCSIKVCIASNVGLPKQSWILFFCAK